MQERLDFPELQVQMREAGFPDLLDLRALQEYRESQGVLALLEVLASQVSVGAPVGQALPEVQASTAM